MDSVSVYAIWAAVIILGLAILGLALFGVRSILQGKVNPFSAAAVLIPAIVLVIFGFVTGDWSVAGIWTLVVMMGLAAASLVVSGIRGLFG